MLAAFVAVGVMIASLVMYGRRDDSPSTASSGASRASSESGVVGTGAGPRSAVEPGAVGSGAVGSSGIESAAIGSGANGANGIGSNAIGSGGPVGPGARGSNAIGSVGSVGAGASGSSAIGSGAGAISGVAPTAPGMSEPHAGAEHHANDASADGQLAPLQPFENAKVGDWIAIEMSSQLGNARPKVSKVLLTVVAADDKMVTLERKVREASLVPPEITRSQRPRKNLTIGELAGNRPGEADLRELGVTDDKHDAGGRTFACKKLTFAMMTDLGKTRFADVEMWISSEVPVDGLVEIKQRFARTSLVVTNRLVGFGNGTAVAWGAKPDGL